ncbi:hydroxyacid dehydrogenase [Candidatus Hecatella orcuttiae]|jgi:D-3-phosphoglycerate dehydrogenase|uniref:hydroxyacid dehydrogenase n=1 Tax=Candidatus Hecatella orcuttiae TaxID=1935119 RepID=UPI0028682200|nr:hydroxyacid dehydrogenase [Candidatus Hecatella orcuttiae]
MVKILVCDKIHEEGLNLLREAGFDVDEKLDLKPEELEKIARDYDALIVRSRTKVTKDVVPENSRVKVIGRVGVGVDNIDAEVIKRTKVLTSPEAVTDAVAELTIGLMIAVARQIPLADSALKKGEWLKSKIMGRQLQGQTLGVIGFGRIGSRVAKIAKTLGMNILAYDPFMNEAALKEVGGKAVSLEELLRNSDIITLHATLLPETYHMIGEKEFAMMKDGVIIINIARGALIDEKALYKALKTGKVAGAGLDCHETEPPTNLELAKLPNVVCTPHIGGQTEEAQRNASVLIAHKIIDFFRK